MTTNHNYIMHLHTCTQHHRHAEDNLDKSWCNTRPLARKFSLVALLKKCGPFDIVHVSQSRAVEEFIIVSAWYAYSPH